MDIHDVNDKTFSRKTSGYGQSQSGKRSGTYVKNSNLFMTGMFKNFLNGLPKAQNKFSHTSVPCLIIKKETCGMGRNPRPSSRFRVFPRQSKTFLKRHHFLNECPHFLNRFIRSFPISVPTHRQEIHHLSRHFFPF